MTRARVALALTAGVVAPLLAACAGGATPGGAPAGTAGTAAAGQPSTTVTVLAAASLKSTFTKLASSFEAAHPGSTVQLSFAGSSALVEQLSQGAPGDVFASADGKNMTKAVDAGVVDSDAVRPFASNTLTIVTPSGNPKKVTSFADLGKADIAAVICAPQVPCGSATKKVEAATGVKVHAVSEENAVTDVLGKVASGQADAGVVYVTDAKGAGDKVTAVPFAQAANAINHYPIAVTKKAANAPLATEFVELVTGAEGRRVLREAGFGEPEK